ncbi:MAG: TolC family protein [Myxococcota bacterium]
MHRRTCIAALLGTLVGGGCASTKPTEARQDVADVIARAGGPSDVVTSDLEEWSHEQVAERVDELLAEPLTVRRATQIALLNNRGLLATFESLGVAQADLVEAGLLKNPMFSGGVAISTLNSSPGGDLGLSQSILSAFLIPAKRRVAKANLQAAVLRVGDASLALIRDVRVAHAEAQAARSTRDLHMKLVQAAEVSDELAQRQHEAGNLTDLQREQVAAALDEARLGMAEHQLEVVATREQLNRLLGLWGTQVDWTLASDSSSLAPPGVELDGLEGLGVQRRLDVSAARFDVESMQYALELRRRGIVPEIEVGIEARNEVGDHAGHEWVLGPTLAIEIPIFNPGHADLARLGAMLRAAEHRLQQTAVDARSHIRMHREQLVAARRRVEYLRDVVVPRRRRVGARALERYNAMLIGAYELFEIQGGVVEARIELAHALRDYWVAWAELERAVGGRLPAR